MGAALMRKPEVAADVRAAAWPPAPPALQAPAAAPHPWLCLPITLCCGGGALSSHRLTHPLPPPPLPQIISTLRRNLPVPVTCKIRVLGADEDTRETVELVRRLERAGAMAIAIHARCDTPSATERGCGLPASSCPVPRSPLLLLHP